MKLFITGISTDVGKTIASAILVEALQADYWKPIQSGDLDHSDSHKIAELISNTKSIIHTNAYAFKTPKSPHLSSKLEDVTIEISKIKEPETTNHLIIEGAGGVYVPLNDTDLIIDLIQHDYQVIVVSRHYLGSINHTLLTIDALQNHNLKIAGIIFSGNEDKATESIIQTKTGVKIIGRINQETYFDKSIIAKYAAIFKPELENL